MTEHTADNDAPRTVRVPLTAYPGGPRIGWADVEVGANGVPTGPVSGTVSAAPIPPAKGVTS